MKSPETLHHAWFDRPLTDAETAALSAELSQSPAAADRLAELAWLEDCLTRRGGGASEGTRRKSRLTRAIATLAAAACIVVGASILYRLRSEPSAPPQAAPLETVNLSVPDGPAAIPPPPRTAEERAAQALERILRRRGLPAVVTEGRSLRELAAEWEATLRADAGFTGRFDVGPLGVAADEPLHFSRPAGSLRGLLTHAAAVAGASLVLGADRLSFEPLSQSKLASRTLRLTGGGSARQAVENFCRSGAIPPDWGLAPHEFAVSSDAERVTVTSSAWNAARLRGVVESLSEPLPPCEVSVTVVPLPAPSGDDADAVWTAVAQGSTLPGVLGVAAALTADQWRECEASARRRGEPVVARVRATLPAGAWMDAGAEAPSVLRWGDQSLVLQPQSSEDGRTIDLVLACGDGIPTAEKPPGLSTTVTLWPEMAVVVGLKTAGGQDCVLAVQVSLGR